MKQSLIRLQHLLDVKMELTSSINDHFSDATESVKAEFRLIEHESQVYDAKSEKRKKQEKESDKDSSDKSPNKKKDEKTKSKIAFKRHRAKPDLNKEKKQEIK